MAKPPLQDESAPSSDSPKKSVPVGANPFAGAGGGLSKPTAKNDKPVAIALRYQKEKDPAPRVVATGEGSFAEQLLEIAFANGVKVREDADLAQVLSVVEVDSIIPLEAFAAVAEIIAYLYRVNAGPSVGGGQLSDPAGPAGKSSKPGVPGTPGAPKPMDAENPLQARARIAADAMRAWNEAAESGEFIPGEAAPDAAGSDNTPDGPGSAAAAGTKRDGASRSEPQDGRAEPAPAPDFLDLASKTDKTL